MTTYATDPAVALWKVHDAAVANGDMAAAEQSLGDINELCGLPREWRSLTERRKKLTTRDDLCPDCEYTPSGFFAAPCAGHACTGCGHLGHDADDGCGHPDSRTGWCECLMSAERKKASEQ